MVARHGPPESCHVIAAHAGQWTGRVEFELWSPRGWRAGVAELVVRRDVVEVWTRRPLGTFHRNEFRAWLHRRHDGPLAADDVEWDVVQGRFIVRLAGSGPYPLPDGVRDQLLIVL
jgi:hypothetical protein